jgi:hypothetical protein
VKPEVKEKAAPKVKVAKAPKEKPITEATTPIPESITDYLVASSRGVSNYQMIPALRKALINEDITAIDVMKKTYPNIFVSSFKYLRKEEKAGMEKLGVEAK